MTAWISDLFGNLSLFCWLFAQAPQIYTNYKNGSVEGLALPFLINWMMGDATNLIGCILTDQLAFQKHLATFFCAIDVILMGQFAYYSSRTPAAPLPPLSQAHSRSRSKSRFRVIATHGDLSSSHHSLPPPTRSPSVRMSESYMSASDHTISHHHPNSSRPASDHHLERESHLYGGEQRPRLSASKHRNRSLIFLSVFVMVGFNLSKRDGSTISAVDAASDPTWAVGPQVATAEGGGLNWEHLIGRMSAWTCALLYFTSRLPQCWLNYRRKSCEGLTMLLFAAAFFGNLTYVVSVLTSPAVKSDPTFLADSAPYLIGSGGTLGFDLTILTQSYLYRPSQTVRSHKSARRRRGSISSLEESEQPLLSASQEAESTDRGRPAFNKHTSAPIPSEPVTLARDSSQQTRSRPLGEGLHVTPILEVSESSPRP